MKANFKPAVLAAGLATSALMALAQPGPGPAADPGAGPDMHQPDGGHRAQRQDRMKEHMARRAAELKAKLKLNADQEASWSAYLAAMKPAAHQPVPKREDLAELSTPERLDKMRDLRKQHEAEVDKRDAATRNFYGSLSAEQKKVFDDNTARAFHVGRQRGPR